MGDTTGIEWARHTWSPWIGCTAVSPACDNCYAEDLTKRWGGDFAVRRRTSPGYWKLLARWNRKAEAAGAMESVFPSMCDPFDNKIPQEWRDDFWEQVRRTPWLMYLLLTKRPQNIRAMLPLDWGCGWHNVSLGITSENQEQLALRAWPLSQIPAIMRFISYEPALGAVDLRNVTNRWDTTWDVLSGRILQAVSGPASTGAFHWVIAGGESGPNARPMHPTWARAVRDQCAVADVPFLFKQWGEHHPSAEHDHIACRCVDTPTAIHADGTIEHRPFEAGWKISDPSSGFAGMCRIGKKRAGRILDGVEHNAFPVCADGDHFSVMEFSQ